ncbi:MAG: YggT family protein [Neomegalonema sp.]|nr:YggT family protein [Neomegalonema sp.]
MASALQIIIIVISSIAQIIFYLVLAQFIISLLLQFEVLNPRQPFVYRLYTGINALLDPLLNPIRRVLPQTGGLDFSPMVLLLGLYVLQMALATVLRNNFAA